MPTVNNPVPYLSTQLNLTIDQKNFLEENFRKDNYNNIAKSLEDYLESGSSQPWNEKLEFAQWAVDCLRANSTESFENLLMRVLYKPNIKINFLDRFNYPVIAKIIDGLYNRVKNDPKLMIALKKYSLMDESQILNNLKSGHGPNLIITVLDANTNGEERGDGNIYLNKLYVSNLHQLSTTAPQSLEFFLASPILHEFVHFGNTTAFQVFPSKRDSNGFYWDAGKQFEEDYFGGDIDYDATNNKIIFKKYF